MSKTDHNAQTAPAVEPRLDGGVRPLREGEVMGAYMEFDRTADRAWTPAEYLVRFGLYVSQRTVSINCVADQPMTSCPHGVPHRWPCEDCGA